MNKKELGIYIHIPFCKRKCYYCDFISYSNNNEAINNYINTLIKEIESIDLQNYDITTIYMGGGTPSYIDSKYIISILNKLKEKLKDNQTSFESIEITIEVNPGTINKEKIESYKKVGINRISLGLQSTNDKILKEIGRIHTYNEFIQAYKIIKEVGFDNINVDLMIGLPNQKIIDIKESLEKIIKLNPTHISVYSLIVEEGTCLSEYIKKGILNLPDEELERQMYWYVKNILELNKYEHYEISNFSKKGFESKHNLNCWNQQEYIGFGVAAHSYLEGKRYSNTHDLQEYIRDFDSKILQENQNEEDKRKEYMMLGLRKIEGVSISKFKEKFIDNPIYIYRKELEKLVNQKLIIIEGDYIRITNKGLDLANLVWEEFV